MYEMGKYYSNWIIASVFRIIVAKKVFKTVESV